MKQILKILVCTLFLLGFGLLIWMVIPESRMERVFTISPDFSLFSEKIECSEVQILLGTKYKINYPKSIRSGESGVIKVDIEKAEKDKSKFNIDNKIETCGSLLEVWIDGEGLDAEPGNKIIKPYQEVPSQFVKFEIFPMNDQVIKGTIWISAVFPGDTKSVLERIPIFAVPFIIQIHSLFGLPPTILKILSLFLIILALVLVIFQKELDRKRK